MIYIGVFACSVYIFSEQSDFFRNTSAAFLLNRKKSEPSQIMRKFGFVLFGGA